ncbi:SDR family NAD(P)-dependent oxidoreductase [Lentzea terrae]|uniref:SDR family NAD(P)-dependent oxidoreductase n=1 Tax=Lentzea terrae TaxID=2200761 RepID=UPI0018E59A14|nr:SDR family NAD(P)-dependent oxidoreductase [Lentzea terrae]
MCAHQSRQQRERGAAGDAWGNLGLARQAAARHWIGQDLAGSITMTSSIAGQVGVPTLAPYAASKGGVNQLVRYITGDPRRRRRLHRNLNTSRGLAGRTHGSATSHAPAVGAWVDLGLMFTEPDGAPLHPATSRTIARLVPRARKA